jgi:putative RNA 2'-phosphotransferase
MTEQEWSRCVERWKMLEFLRYKATDRKLRLFAVACCRTVSHLLTDNRSHHAIEVAEDFADDKRSEEDLACAWEAAGEVSPAEHGSPARHHSWQGVHAAAWQVAEADAFDAARTTAVSTCECTHSPEAARQVEASQCCLLRCIFSNPFHPVTLQPSWLTSTVNALTEAVYQERAFDRLPILADALEDAGCTNTDCLNHCRYPGVHVLGCWCVDLILGKERSLVPTTHAMKDRLTNISKYLARHLRHAPEDLGLTLQPGGWVPVAVLLDEAARAGFPITRSELVQCVQTNDKQRFSFDDTGKCIRANQGHSVEVDLQLEELAPPEVLYHGTVARFLPSICAEGLNKGSRHDVHLSKDEATARKVGSRRGKPVIIRVEAGRMHRDGFKFFLSANGVWLTDAVPARYLAQT